MWKTAFKKFERVWSTYPYPFKFLKAVFHKFYLAHPWILSRICCYCNNRLNSVMAVDLVLIWGKWVYFLVHRIIMSGINEYRMWLKLKNISRCTLPWLWQIKYSNHWLEVCYSAINMGKIQTHAFTNTWNALCDLVPLVQFEERAV